MDFDWVDRSSTATDSFSAVFQNVRARPASVPLFAATAWSIWYQRNKTRLQDNPLPLCNVAGFARNYLSEFRGMDRPCVHRKGAGPRRWIPPASDIVKINYDGAIFAAPYSVVVRMLDGLQNTTSNFGYVAVYLGVHVTYRAKMGSSIAYSTDAELKAQKAKIVELERHAYRVEWLTNMATEPAALPDLIEDAKAEAFVKFQSSQAYFDKLGVKFGEYFRHFHERATIPFPNSGLDFTLSN
nr:hypothetical protein CFP56_34358 [Quercus suber]